MLVSRFATRALARSSFLTAVAVKSSARPAVCTSINNNNVKFFSTSDAKKKEEPKKPSTSSTSTSHPDDAPNAIKKRQRIVIAVGGNALQRRGERLTIENMLKAAADMAPTITQMARDHQLVLTHGNGPQVGELALERSAATLDVLGKHDIGVGVDICEFGVINEIISYLHNLLTLMLFSIFQPLISTTTRTPQLHKSSHNHY